jgi:hypothetical protein
MLRELPVSSGSKPKPLSFRISIDKNVKHNGRVRFYEYPSGGAAIETIDGFKAADGATVSRFVRK